MSLLPDEPGGPNIWPHPKNRRPFIEGMVGDLAAFVITTSFSVVPMLLWPHVGGTSHSFITATAFVSSAAGCQLIPVWVDGYGWSGAKGALSRAAGKALASLFFAQLVLVGAAVARGGSYGGLAVALACGLFVRRYYLVQVNAHHLDGTDSSVRLWLLLGTRPLASSAVVGVTMLTAFPGLALSAGRDLEKQDRLPVSIAASWASPGATVRSTARSCSNRESGDARGRSGDRENGRLSPASLCPPRSGTAAVTGALRGRVPWRQVYDRSDRMHAGSCGGVVARAIVRRNPPPLRFAGKPARGRRSA